jgi:PAS domain S-box-containing protein
VLEQTVAERTAQLQLSEARFKSFTKLSSDWYWEQDVSGNFISAEGPVFEMLGIRPVDLDDDSTQNMKPEDADHDAWNQAEYAQLHDKIESRAPFLNYVYRRILSDGSEQLLQVSGEPIFDAGGRFTGYRGIGMELNDRRRVNTEAVYLRTAFDSIDLAMLIFDGESKILIDANQAARDLFAIAYHDLANIDLKEIGLRDMHLRDTEFSQLNAASGMLQEHIQLRKRSGQCGPMLIQWRAYASTDQNHDHKQDDADEKWIIFATISEVESITVFDGLD